jgi:hypothetical protein
VAQITSENAINAIMKLLAEQALELLDGTLIMGNLINRNFEAAVMQQGEVVNVPIPPIMQAVNLAEGGDMTNQVSSLGNAQVVLNTHCAVPFQIGDIAKVLSSRDLAKMYLNSAILAVAERVETDIMNCYALFTDQTKIGGAAAIDEGKVDDAETALFNVRVPQAEPKYLIVNSGTYSDIRMLPKFSEADKIGPGTAEVAIKEGFVGRLKGLNIFRSHFVQATAGPLVHNIAFARDALALVTRQMPAPPPGTGTIAEYANKGGFGMRILMSYNHMGLGTQFSVDTLFGVGPLRNNFGIHVETNTV